MKLLDLFCGAGGADYGYSLAGFDVTGVDLKPQPHYPFEFIQGDALTYLRRHGGEYDVIHASPPCQAYTRLQAIAKNTSHPRLIGPTRRLLIDSGKPWVIENVEDAFRELWQPVRLCGSSFGLRVRRHRLFETSFVLTAPPCDHRWQDESPIYPARVSKSRGTVRMTGVISVHGGNQTLLADELTTVREAMGIGWMTKSELNQAIPPAYTRYVGENLMRKF